jgi:hypothetical protein
MNGLAMAKRQDTSTKISPEALRIAKIVAAYHGESQAEYLSRIVLEKATEELRGFQSSGAGLPATPPKRKPPKRKG